MLILTAILVYGIDIFLVGIVFYFFKAKYGWSFSLRFDFLILLIIFIFLENYLWPSFFILNVTYTIHNETIANFLGLKPNESLTESFGFGVFELIVWSIQAFLANIIGSKIVNPQFKESI